MRPLLLLLMSALALHFAGCTADTASQSLPSQDMLVASLIVDPLKDSLRLFWKDPNGFRYGSLERLRTSVDSSGSSLCFAMNGGMYMPDGRPQGLYIESGRTLVPLDTSNGNGNFYLKPNGVLSVSRAGIASVVRTSAFRNSDNLAYATQSGPMLLIDGRPHPAFRKGSANLNIRNGVGIMKDGRLLFAISKRPINFYDFAMWFRTRGCVNALYLDGLVSRAYIPSIQWEQLDGDFGVIIGITGTSK